MRAAVITLALAACGDGAALTRDAIVPRDSDGPEDAEVDDARAGDARDGDDDGDGATPVEVCDTGCFACELGGCDRVVGLTVGRLGACVLLASGEPICWGRAVAGALGEGLHGAEPLPPFRVHDRPPLVELGLAGAHACGRGGDGTIWCWGAGYHRVALADHPSLAALAPVARLDGARRVAVGPLGTGCALRDDGVWCWGLRLDGVESDEVGATFAATPERIEALPAGDRTELALGAFAACAWDRDADRLECFGAHGHGQLGAGAGVEGGPTPRPVVRAWGDAPIAALAVGLHHGCVIAGDALWCWGDLDPVAPAPVRVAEGLGAADVARPLAAGRDLTCAIVGAERGVRCWGAPSPTLTGVVELAAAYDVICARTDAERVACWRSDRAAVDIVYRTAEPGWCVGSEGALRLGDDAPEACHVCGPDGEVVPCPFGCERDRCLGARGLTAGEAHTCALVEGGAAWCWGERGAPERVAELPPLVTLAAGRAHTCGLGADGAVVCWGGVASPPVIAEPRAGALDAGGDTTCAVAPGGEVVCWANALAPARVEGLEGFVADRVAVAVDAACVSERVAPPARPRVACWGQGDEGQLGGPAGPWPEARVVPAVGLPSEVGALAAGRAHVILASTGAGTIAFGWGANEAGQLLGDAAVRPPSQVLGAWSFNLAALAAGDAFTCALERTGRLTCFGAADHGQLGPAATGARASTPVVVPGLGPSVALAAGARHACAIDRAGFVRCWGDNREGQLGSGGAGSDFAPEPRWVRAP